MISAVQAFLNRQSASFQDDGPRLAVSDYDFPLPVLARTGRSILTSPQDFIDHWARMNASCRQAGGDSLSLRLVARELPRGGRFRLWLRYDYLTPKGETAASMDAVCFCRDRGPRLCVEMIEVAGRWGQHFASPLGQPASGAMAAR